MGYSDPGPHPRTSQQIVNELVSLLDAMTIDKVVLVGASIGGWNVRVFASEHPERTASLVLVDARHEDQGEKLAGAGAPENPPWVVHIAAPVAYLGIARFLGIAPGLPVDFYAPEVRKYVLATRFRSSALIAAASELRDGR
jgi:pimeloyl-ACP methyl ester carboxylesterase